MSLTEPYYTYCYLCDAEIPYDGDESFTIQAETNAEYPDGILETVLICKECHEKHPEYVVVEDDEDEQEMDRSEERRREVLGLD